MYLPLKFLIYDLGNKSSIVAISFFLFLLVGCSSEKELIINGIGDLQLNCPGKQEKIFYTQGDNHRNLVEWLRNNKKGWNNSPASYVPRIVIKGENFNLNIIDNLVVVNYQGKQYVKSINDDFFNDICE